MDQDFAALIPIVRVVRWLRDNFGKAINREQNTIPKDSPSHFLALFRHRPLEGGNIFERRRLTFPMKETYLRQLISGNGFSSEMKSRNARTRRISNTSRTRARGRVKISYDLLRSGRASSSIAESIFTPV